ncbi:transcriptional regulator [Clostridium sp. CAG:768]|nr:transcriptional regulator [Clostridium sp. CAG:768]
MSIKKNLGNRIREIRISRSLTQEMLAEKINMSAKSLSQIELGNNFVSAETLEEICIALDIPPSVLFDFKYADVTNENSLDDIIKRLKNNPNLLKTVYKIVMALDY